MEVAISIICPHAPPHTATTLAAPACDRTGSAYAKIGQEVAKRTFTLLAGLLLALYAAPSHAEMGSGDGINFDLLLPKGFCALWRINCKEKPHYDLQDRMQA